MCESGEVWGGGVGGDGREEQERERALEGALLLPVKQEKDKKREIVLRSDKNFNKGTSVRVCC